MGTIEHKLKQYLHIVKDILDCHRIFVINSQNIHYLNDKLKNYEKKIKELISEYSFNEDLQNKALTTLHEIDIHINVADISKDIFNGIED